MLNCCFVNSSELSQLFKALSSRVINNSFCWKFELLEDFFFSISGIRIIDVSVFANYSNIEFLKDPENQDNHNDIAA